MREPVKSLMTKYDDPKNFDALSRAQSSMDELKDIAASNINKMMQNQQNLTVKSSAASPYLTLAC